MRNVKVRLVVVTAAGKNAVDKEVSIAPGATIAEVLQAQGISAEGMEVSVDGKPVKDLTKKIDAGAKLSITERPKGS